MYSKYIHICIIKMTFIDIDRFVIYVLLLLLLLSYHLKAHASWFFCVCFSHSHKLHLQFFQLFVFICTNIPADCLFIQIQNCCQNFQTEFRVLLFFSRGIVHLLLFSLSQWNLCLYMFNDIIWYCPKYFYIIFECI